MFLPYIDVCEGPTEIFVFVEVPGVERQDVRISWNDNVLTIAGHKRQQPNVRNANYMCVERSYGPFRREVVIGVPIDRKKARAELRDGLMKICLPKALRDEERRDSIPIE